MKRIPKSVPAVEDKTRSSSPPPRALQGTTRPRWPHEPQEHQTAIWFLGRCHYIEMEETARNLKRFIRECYQELSGEKGDELDPWWLKTQVTYWLQRCDHERRGAPLTEEFWRNYDAAMGGCVGKFDADIQSVLKSMESQEESTMAKTVATTTTAPVAAPAKKPLPVPAKKLPAPAKKVVAPATPAKKAAPVKVSTKAPVAVPAKVATKVPTKKVIGGKMSLIDAGISVLTTKPQKVSAIYATVIARKLWTPGAGLTPVATLSAALGKALAAGRCKKTEDGFVKA